METKIKKQKKQGKRSPLMGWICPRCGKVHSPFSLECDCFHLIPTTEVIKKDSTDPYANLRGTDTWFVDSSISGYKLG